MSSFLWSFEVLTHQIKRLCCLTDLPSPASVLDKLSISFLRSEHPTFLGTRSRHRAFVHDLRMPPLLPGMCHCNSTGALCVHQTCQVTLLHLKSLSSFSLPVVLTQRPRQLSLLAPELLQLKTAASGQRLKHENVCLCFLAGSCAWTISPHENLLPRSEGRFL